MKNIKYRAGNAAMAVSTTKWQISVRVLMKREPNSRVTYCQTAAISPRAAKAQQGKTQRDRAATKRDVGKERVSVGSRDVKGAEQSGVWRLIAVDLHNKRGRQAARAPLLRH